MAISMHVFGDLLNFLKNPIYDEDKNSNLKYRITYSGRFLALNFVFSFLGALLLTLITSIFKVDLGDHAISLISENHGLLYLMFYGVIAAPIIEETIFRGPLIFFKNKPYFKFIVYLGILLFGIIHIFNFQNYNNVFWLAPILVAPQLIGGAIFSLVRIKFGLLWSILLHVAHNLVLFIFLVVGKI